MPDWDYRGLDGNDKLTTLPGVFGNKKDKPFTHNIECTAVVKYSLRLCNTCCCRRGLVDGGVASFVINHQKDSVPGGYAICPAAKSPEAKTVTGIKDPAGNGYFKLIVQPPKRKRQHTCQQWFNIVDTLGRSMISIQRSITVSIRYGHFVHAGIRCLDSHVKCATKPRASLVPF